MKKINLMQGVEYSHWILKQHLEAGDYVVDATVGNGHDTSFLANLVGKNGKVYGFDVQKMALKRAEERLKENNVFDRVKLIFDGHENINEYITEDKIAAILFNLGYLPGSDKEVITKAKTTIKAVKSSIKILKQEGIIVLVIYPGHSGGEKEKQSIIEYAKNLDRKKFNILHYYYLNQENKPPEVMVIKKR